MGITDFFKKKPSKEEARQIFINNLLKKYFGASKQKLITDEIELRGYCVKCSLKLEQRNRIFYDRSTEYTYEVEPTQVYL